MSKDQKLIRNLVFIAFYVALAIVLEMVSKFIPFEMKNGGKLELHVIALFMASFQMGWKQGGLVALLTFILETMLGMNSWMTSFVQVLLDYVFPLLACGIASIFPRIKQNNVYSGIVCGMVLKYISHVLVGVYFWFPEGEAAGSWASWVYSLNYNTGYNVATLIAAIIIVPTLIKAIKNTIHSPFATFAGIKE